MRPFDTQTQNAIEFAAELIWQSKSTVVLTGAGFSTPSGIPDFRSEGTGLWSRDEPMEVASLTTFRHTPERFFEWFRPLAGQIYNAQPNPAHIALSRLEKAGYLRAIITQNIDLLHEKANSQNVIPVHGTLSTLTCTKCFQQVGHDEYLPSYLSKGDIPRCARCQGVLKPDVILFGEQLPQKNWHDAQRASRECDLMIVAGSSLEVLPVAGLPMQALDRGAHLVIINQSVTYLNIRADIAILDDVAIILPAIADLVLKG